MTLINAFKTSVVVVLASSFAILPTPSTPAQTFKEHMTEKVRESRSPPMIHYETADLPDPVKEMRQSILEAARTGDIEELGPVIESNELPPIVSFDGNLDPIRFWRRKSRDGKGREILATMIKLFETGYVKLHAGTADEVYVWPYFAEIPVDKLTPAQLTELKKLLPARNVEAMLKTGRYSYYRAAISSDGTWQYFTADD